VIEGRYSNEIEKGAKRGTKIICRLARQEKTL